MLEFCLSPPFLFGETQNVCEWRSPDGVAETHAQVQMRSFSLLVLLHKPPAGKKAGPGSRKNTDELWKQVEQPPLSGALTPSFVFYFFYIFLCEMSKE